jgi:hypothetical protein
LLVSRDDLVLHVHTCEELRDVMWRLQHQLLLTKVTVYHTEIASKHAVESIAIVEGNTICRSRR